MDSSVSSEEVFCPRGSEQIVVCALAYHLGADSSSGHYAAALKYTEIWWAYNDSDEPQPFRELLENVCMLAPWWIISADCFFSVLHRLNRCLRSWCRLSRCSRCGSWHRCSRCRCHRSWSPRCF